MGLINTKLQDSDRALEVIRERAMQLRQIERALDRLGFGKLSEEIGSIAEDLVDETSEAKKSIDTLVAELVAEAKEAANGEGTEGEEEEYEVVETPVAVAVADEQHFGA